MVSKNSNQTDQSAKRLIVKHFITSNYSQLIGGLFFAILLPAVFQYQHQLFPNFQFIYKANEIHTLIGAACAIIIGYIIMRRLSGYPGVTAVSYVLISFSITYAVAMTIFFMLRLDYSRYLFSYSFMLCLLWFITIHFVARRLINTRLVIIPGGNTEELSKIEWIRWTLLKSPETYKPSNGAIVVDLRQDLSPNWERFIADCALQGIPVYHTKQVQESLTGKVAIEHLSENSLGSLLPGLIYLRFKQVIEFALALVLLPAFLIILVVVSLAILLTSGGPALFRQKRVGYRGKRFTVYKFRTMVTGKDGEIEEQNNDDRDKKLRDLAITRDNDTRITRMGFYLRKFRIDEIPQIINILKGEMSWIGPRPEAEALSEWYERELPFYRYRHIVKPGITGWAQVNQGHVSDTDQVLEKLHYDFFYIKNLSAWLDFLIVLKTIQTILSGFWTKTNGR